MENKIYALTGVTGLLGRNVFFEIIKDNLINLDNIEIVILGRASKDESLSKRIENIFHSEGLNYLSVDSAKLRELNLFFETKITYVNIDLSSSEIITDAERIKLIGKSINYFFHIAASTDFRSDKKTIKRLHQQNVIGTSQVLELCSGLNIKEFAYVSSAYACGCSYGDIKADYINLNQEFRNPYEKTKLQGEILVKEYQKRTGLRCRIFRPSTISGKLLENKKGEIYKFDVFYSWAAFFLRWKLKHYCDSIDMLYNEKINMDMRIMINPYAGLNIVPVDFAAKTLYQVCKQNIEGAHFHLVNEHETPHVFYLSKILEACNITGFTFVEDMPKDLSSLEFFFYKTVGAVFTPYSIQNEIKFNTDNLQELYRTQNLYCPQINQDNFKLLMDYAKSKNFGLKDQKS